MFTSIFSIHLFPTKLRAIIFITFNSDNDYANTHIPQGNHR